LDAGIYADDVVDTFVTKASEVGIDIFRVFDTLNDERNFMATFMQFLKKQYGISWSADVYITPLIFSLCPMLKVFA
jgi:pyruvate/oxaloacetate carboxyltransferase